MVQTLADKVNRNIYIFFVVMGFLFYGNSLKNKYALDDNFVTVTNSPEPGKAYVPDNDLVTNGFRSIPKIWKSRYAHDGEGSFDYRPFVTTTFAIEYGIFGQNPFVSHLLNLVFYIICVCVVHKLILRLFIDKPYKHALAFLCAFLFLIHPLHTEVVDNLKSRDEIFSFIFSCLALIYGIRFVDHKNKRDILWVIFYLLLGLFSKRTATMAFVVIPMSLYFFRGVKIKNILLSFGLLFLLYVLFALSKKVMLHEAEVRNFYHFENPLYFEHPSLIGKVLIALKVLGFYIVMLIFPFPMRFYYGHNLINVDSSPDIYSFVSIVFFIASGWYFYKTRNIYFLYAVLLFLGTITPFLNFFTPVPGIVGDRLSFTASLGFCLVIALVVLPYFNKLDPQKLSMLTFTTRPFLYLSWLAVVCMIYTINRNSNWHDRFTLFKHDIQYMDESSKGQSLLANEYFEKMNRSISATEAKMNAENALRHYKMSIKADSSMFTACNNAGVVLFTFYKDYPEAVRYFRLAAQAKPGYAQAYENIGNSYMMMLKNDSAALYYNKAIESNPKQYASYDGIARMYGDSKDYKRAIDYYNKALEVFPNEYYFTTQKANYVFMDGRVAEGLALFEEAFRLNPNDKLGAFLMQKFGQANNTEKAEYYRKYHY